MDPKTKIKKHISSSLFLDKERKDRIRKILEVATPGELDALLKILESEKDDLKSMVRSFLAEKGQEGVETIEFTILKIKKTFTKTSEKKSAVEDQKRAEEILSQI